MNSKIYVGIAVIITVTLVGIYVYNGFDFSNTWEFEVVPGQEIEYQITQEMINCVGSNDPDDVFANIIPSDAAIVVYQQKIGGGWVSWVNGEPANDMNFVRVDVPIIVFLSANEPSATIIIYKS